MKTTLEAVKVSEASVLDREPLYDGNKAVFKAADGELATDP